MSDKSVMEYLERHRFGRPQTVKEISLSVEKSEFAVIRELNSLLLRGSVHVITVYFNNKGVPFYTVREDVRVDASHDGRPHHWRI